MPPVPPTAIDALQEDLDLARRSGSPTWMMRRTFHGPPSDHGRMVLHERELCAADAGAESVDARPRIAGRVLGF